MLRTRILLASAAVVLLIGGTLAFAAQRRGTSAMPQATAASVGVPASALPGKVVDVEAGEFFFRAPDTIAAGLTTFRLRQTGLVVHRLAAGERGRRLVADKGDATRGAHMLWVVRLEQGKTVTDLYRAAVAGERTPEWATQLGGPSFALPPRTSNVTLDLPAGNYALVCYIGSARADRTRAHLLNGMFRALTVVPRVGPNPVAPTPDVTARITGKGTVRFSRPISAGTNVIRAVNETSEDYEFKFQRVPHGTSGARFLAQQDTAGPGTPWGGLGSVPANSAVVTTIDFTPGEYVVGTWPPIRHETSHSFVVAPPR